MTTTTATLPAAAQPLHFHAPRKAPAPAVDTGRRVWSVDEVAAFLESYALRFELPVRMSTRVDSLDRRADGTFISRLTATCRISKSSRQFSDSIMSLQPPETSMVTSRASVRETAQS